MGRLYRTRMGAYGADRPSRAGGNARPLSSLTVKTALVLGAGGPAGWVYHAGVVAALAETREFDPNRAALLLGTSAGASIGASLAAGTRIDAILEAVERGPTEDQRAEYMRMMAERKRTYRPLAPSLARSVLPGGTGVGVAVTGLLPSGWFPTYALGQFIGVDSHEEWPENLWITAVNAETGQTEVFGRDRRDLTVAEAVEASSAVPAMFQPKIIDGHRFVDGATASPTHADLAAGIDPDTVIISSPMSRPTRRPMSVLARRRLAAERESLEEAGIRVLVVQPGEEDVETFRGFPRVGPERSGQIIETGRRTAREAIEAG